MILTSPFQPCDKPPVHTLGLTPWNLSCFEFKFDDTRLYSWCKNKIGPIEISLCCALTLLSLCPVGCLRLAFLHWDSQPGRDATNRNFNWANFILILGGKSGTYHQIWIQNNLGFMVLILIYIKIKFENANNLVSKKYDIASKEAAVLRQET